MRVAVYCSSSVNIENQYVDLAFDFGTALALAGVDLVWGGGQVSMMGAVAKAVRQGGGKTFGVIPEHLMRMELSDPESNEMFIVDTMRNRKQKMDDLSDAFVILPGGIGTLDEFFEIWTAKYLGFHSKPIVICDPYGAFAPLRSALDHLLDLNFMNIKQEGAIAWCEDIPSALKAIGLQPLLMGGISELLASLPQEERIILTLHYLKGKSANEIAKMLGVPERAVNSVITSGKTRLLSALNQG